MHRLPSWCGSRDARTGKFLASEILLANSDAGISPHASIAIPYRFTARPVARRRSNINRWWRWIIAWPGDCGSDNGTCGEASDDSGRYIPAACTHWRDPGSGKGQQESHDDKLLHLWPSKLRDIEEAPAMGWVGMDRRGFVRVPGRQTDPARQNDNVEWYLTS